MSLASQSDQQLLAAWKEGDQRGAELLVRRYQIRLIALARSRLSRRLARRTDPEDVVMSAWRSFFVAANEGLSATTDDLWPLLATFTMRKLARHAERHLAGRRAVEMERPLDGSHFELVSREPKPDEVGSLIEDVESLLASLEPNEREIISLSLEGLTHKEIARKLNCSDRTIRRVFADVKARLSPSEQQVVHKEVDPASTTLTSPTTMQIPYSDLQLLTLIGQGRFGKVYRALHAASGQIVAVKFLRKTFWQEQEAVASLFREASLVSELSHPNLVQHLGWGRTPHGAVYLVMEWIDGANLAEPGMAPMAFEAAVECLRQIASVLVVAQQAGILHGDLTPANVLRTRDGRYVLTDFGFARSTVHAAPAQLGGTPGFLAPEQVSDAFGPVTFATDVYGLAGLFCFLISGRPPVEGDSIPELLSELVLQKPVRIPEEIVMLDSLRELMQRCLSKVAGERQSSVAELLSAVEQLG